MIHRKYRRKLLLKQCYLEMRTVKHLVNMCLGQYISRHVQLEVNGFIQFVNFLCYLTIFWSFFHINRYTFTLQFLITSWYFIFWLYQNFITYSSIISYVVVNIVSYVLIIIHIFLSISECNCLSSQEQFLKVDIYVFKAIAEFPSSSRFIEIYSSTICG